MKKNLQVYVNSLLVKARDNSLKLVNLSTFLKNKALREMARALRKNKDYIIKENHQDLLQAEKKKRPSSFVDRLKLTSQRIEAIASSLEDIAQLPDPVGQIISGYRRPNGLKVFKVRVPVGVVLIIYESRPNVTSDCIGLCLKSSNFVILRGGSDAFYSNRAIVKVLSQSIEPLGLKDLFLFVENQSYEVVDYLLKKGAGFIDLVIPRGGEELIRRVASLSKIPVIKHYKGICHIYVDEFASIDKAVRICVNAKVQRPAVCNAMETLLVHKNIAQKFLPCVFEEYKKYNVEIRGCSKTLRILPQVKKAKQKDWTEEYLDLILAVKVVEDIEEAIIHINTYGSLHTDSIISENYSRIKKFVEEVQSACVFVNISTRFSDGGEFGLGAEIGISTDKLHARGPMGLKELTTYKWLVYGDGQIRQ